MSDDSNPTSAFDHDTFDDIPANVFAARRLDSSKRRQRVQQVRLAIAAEEYENDLKLSVAIDRLLDRLPDA